MFPMDTAYLRDAAARATGCAFERAGGAVEIACGQGGDGLRVRMADGRAEIEARDAAAAARGYLLVAQALLDGKDALDVRETPRFRRCGPMLDMSRGGVLTVAAAKRYIERAALLGLNLVMLYTEDVYEVPEYPHFGYLRGRYSQDDLRALDDHAARFGVELVPCIQTLAHLQQFLQWQPSAPLKDTDYCLLIDAEETYRFIACQIRAIRKCFRSDTLMIGMDEAAGVGLGRYYDLHGATDRHALLSRHAARVAALCAENGFTPVMWSDMYFRLGSKTNSYYDPEAVITREIAEGIPDVTLCYWDYYHFEQAFYERMIERHRGTGRPLWFAGGVWTWSGFLPNVARTEATTLPAVRACLAQGVDTVVATMWGDDGTETNLFLGLPLLALFSEAMWRGEGFDMADARRKGEIVSRIPDAVTQNMRGFYLGKEDERPGKAMIWGDPLFNLSYGAWDPMAFAEQCEEARRAIAPCAAGVIGGAGVAVSRYMALLLDIAAQKARLTATLRTAYKAGDREALRAAAEKTLPQLAAQYERLMDAHARQWEATYKRNGWETMCLRYGGAIARAKDAAREIMRWVDGEIAEIVELEEVPLPAKRRGGMQFYEVYSRVDFGF